MGRAALCVAWLLGQSLSVAAAEIPFSNAELFYDFDGQPLQSFYEGFFAEQGLAVSMSAGVTAQRGTLNGPRRGSPETLFESISQSNQVLSYYDGSVVHLYKPQEQVSRYFTVGRAKASRFQRVYGDLKLGNRHNKVNISSANGVVAANGAPFFVEQVEQLIGAIGNEPVNIPDSEATLRYFPLRYAFAADTTVYVGRRETVVPGVATLLRQAVTGQGGVGSIVVPDRRRRGATRLRGQGLAEERASRALASGSVPQQFIERYADEITEQAPTQSLAAAAPPASNEGPYIVADSMHNAILIRDKPSRMAMYQNLIEILDVEPALVEIIATVIDLDKEKLRRTGLDLRLRGTDVGIGFGDPDAVQDLINADVADEIDLIPALAGLTATGAVIGDTLRFSARLNALDDRNLAKVVSSPQIITLNDMEAVIQSNREVFIPVGGTFEVDLFDVIAGTTLRVTPHVINDAGRRRIRIATSIEDGDVQLVSSSVQNAELPIVDRNVITTQAIIDEGQSLLIGGLRRTTEIKRKRGVPILRSIPVVKHIFSNAQKEADASERLFLITPRLVGRQQVLELSDDAARIEEDFDGELERF